MISLRLLAGAAIGAAVAGFATGRSSLRDAGREPPLAAAPASESAGPREAPPGAPLPPAPAPGAKRPRVPAGILARAAEARALGREQSCPPDASPDQPARCVPAQRESIEIDWHVAPRP